jgi:hypothetical protein
MDFPVNHQVSRNELIERLLNQSAVKELSNKENQFIRSLPVENLIAAYSKSLEYCRKGLLVFCASRTPNSTLMWSHYADSHKGVCIGFYLPVNPPFHESFTFNVHYSNNITPINVFSGTPQDRSVAFYKWLNIKSIVWEYEEEVRCCILNMEQKIPSLASGYSDIVFPKNLFSEIIFGAGVEQNSITEFRNYLIEKKYDIKRFAKMEISQSTFDLKYCILT